jgi:hypothetical protein
MTKRLIFLILFFSATIVATAQVDHGKLYFGLDLLKSVPLVFQTGYVLEPSLVYKTKNSLIIDIAFGINDIRKDSLYRNVQYQNKGHYFKLGFGMPLLGKVRRYNEFNLTASLIYSEFTEKGRVFFKGPYYGDLMVTLQQPNQLVAFEIQPNYWLPVSERCSFNFQVRLVLLLNDVHEKYFPAYYVPGAGYIQGLGKKGDNLPESYRYTGGLAVRFVYRFLPIHHEIK